MYHFIYDSERFKVLNSEKELFYFGIFDDGEIYNAQNELSAKQINKWYSSFIANCRLIINDTLFENEELDFRLKKLSGKWQANSKIGIVTFNMLKGHNSEILVNKEPVGRIKLNEKQFYNGIWQYDFQVIKKEFLVLFVIFSAYFIATTDTEGTRMPTSLGNIG